MITSVDVITEWCREVPVGDCSSKGIDTCACKQLSQSAASLGRIIATSPSAGTPYQHSNISVGTSQRDRCRAGLWKTSHTRNNTTNKCRLPNDSFGGASSPLPNNRKRNLAFSSVQSGETLLSVSNITADSDCCCNCAKEERCDKSLSGRVLVACWSTSFSTVGCPSHCSGHISSWRYCSKSEFCAIQAKYAG